MGHIEQELEIMREELRQVWELAKLSETTYPTFITSIYFPMAYLPSADLPNQPESTQHVPVHGQVPPAFSTMVRTIPDLSNCDPTKPTMQ